MKIAVSAEMTGIAGSLVEEDERNDRSLAEEIERAIDH
jgi:hypothetical protein